MQGRLDSPLTPDGYECAQHAGCFLRDAGVSRIVSSPLGRALATAKAIGAACTVPVHVDDRIREMDHGLFDGMTIHDARLINPCFIEERRADRWNVRWINGESYQDVFDRALSFSNDILRLDGRNVAVIAHETVNKCILGALLELSHDEIMNIKQGNSTIFEVNLARGTWDSVSLHEC